MSESRRLPAKRSQVPALFAFAVISAALAVHAAHYHPYFVDDSFISMRYGARLATGRGLTWTDGERVEGYSNLLWVLLLALGRLFTADLVTWARVLGSLGMGAALAAIVWAYRPTRLRDLGPPLFGGLLIAFSGPTAAWTIAGLEHPLLIGLLLWGLVLTARNLSGSTNNEVGAGSPAGVVAPALVFAPLVLVRADAVLFVFCAVGAILVTGTLKLERIRLALALLVIPILALAGQLIFRRIYYEDWFPNTYYAKVAYTTERFVQGWKYVSHADWLYRAPFVVVSLGVLALPFAKGSRRRLVLFLLPCCAWFAYVVAIGGDNMPQRRHLAPFVALAGLVGAELFAWASRALPRGPILASVLAVTALAQLAHAQLADPARQRAVTRTWVWSGRPIGELLQRAFAKTQPLIAVDAAGVLPYFAKLPALDMLGLNDRYLAHHPPKSFGTGWVGHELGNGAYVMRREPDLIVFGLPTGGERAVWRSGKEMQRKPLFKERYQLVTFDPQAPERIVSRIWVRRDGGKTGIAREGDTIRVPGYLLEGRQVRAQLRRERLGAAIPRGASAWLRLKLSSGVYRTYLAAEGTPLVSTDRGASWVDDVLTVETAEQDVDVRLQISARHQDLWVHEISFKRSQAPVLGTTVDHH